MIEGIIQEFLFNYTQIILFFKSFQFGKYFQLIFLYIIEYNISLIPHDPPLLPVLKSGVVTPQPPRLTPMLQIRDVMFK